MRVIRMAVVSLGLVLPAMAPVPQEYATALRSARAALVRDDFPTALGLLDRAIRLGTEAPAAFILLGQTYMRLERYADACDALTRGAELAGGIQTAEGAGVLQMLALALARDERNAEALELLDRLVAANPSRPAIWLLRGNIHLALGQPDLAKSDFEKEIQLHPGEGPGSGSAAPSRSPLAAAYEGLGICAYRLGDDAVALEALGRAADGLDARYHLALTLARLGRHAGALDVFQEVLARDAGHRGALQGLARSAGVVGRGEERARALSSLEALYRLDEERRSVRIKASSLRTRANAKAAAGDSRGASTDLEEAVRLAPDDMELRLDLGRALSRAGEDRRGEQVLRDLIAHDGLNAEAHYQLGRLLLDGEDPAAAAIPFETACRIAPMKAVYHAALGQAYIGTRRLDAGIQELRLAKELAPDDPESSYNLGLGLAEAGALREAVEELEAAASRNRTDPRPHEALAALYARLGDPERSRRERELFRKLSSQPVTPA